MTGSIPTASEARTSRPRRPSGWQVAVLAVPALLAGLVLLLAGGGSPRPVPEGVPDPGLLTGWGLPAVTLGAKLAGLVVVGCLFTPLLTMTRPTGRLEGPGLRAVWTVRRLAVAWLLLGLAQIVLMVSDQLAVPVWQLGRRELYGYVVQVDQVQSMLAQALVAGVIAVTSRWVLTVIGASVLLVVALVSLLPPAVTGHPSGEGAAETISLALHVIAVTVWAGGVLALWWHLGGTPRLRATAARRFTAIAAWCLALTAVSGVVNASAQIGSLSDWVGSAYGRGVLLKVLALGAVGLLALQLRRTARGSAATDPRAWRGFAILTGIELAVMSAAVGLGVALTRTPPPMDDASVNTTGSVLGGSVPLAPTVGLAVVLVVLVGLALAPAAVRRRRADPGEACSTGRRVRE